MIRRYSRGLFQQHRPGSDVRITLQHALFYERRNQGIVATLLFQCGFAFDVPMKGSRNY